MNSKVLGVDIYIGDKGTSSLFNMERVGKDAGSKI